MRKSGQDDLWKLVIFSKASRRIIIKLALGISYQFYLASSLESRVLSLFPLSYNGSKLSVKLSISGYAKTFCSLNCIAVYI